MKIQKTIFTISFVVLMLIMEATANPLDVPEDITKWYQTQPPKKGWLLSSSPKPYLLTDPGVALHLANNSQYEWVVFKTNDKVCVKRRMDRNSSAKLPFPVPRKRAFAGQQISFLVEDGWLIGFNAGEWGGSLWWFSIDGKQKYRIFEDQIIQFLKVEGDIYALEGLAHMGKSRGKIVRLVRGKEPDSRWKSQIFAVLPEAPKTSVLLGKDFLVVTSGSLVRVRADRKVETLLSNCFWWATNPNSIVLDNEGFMYIGMKQGVIRWRPGDKPETMRWLVPSEKFLKDELNRFNRRKN